jgi:site-specific recombinase XerD
VEDRSAPTATLVDLDGDRPSAEQFIGRVLRELRIRYYQPRTMKGYGIALRTFLTWLDDEPASVTLEDVREFLEHLVDRGLGSSTVSLHLAAIRVAFDKLCRREVTIGLETPRRAKRLPAVLSSQDVLRILGAAPSIRDKLLLGLMYATGVRVSEVTALRARDIDFERRTINVRLGKGRKDLSRPTLHDRTVPRFLTA